MHIQSFHASPTAAGHLRFCRFWTHSKKLTTTPPAHKPSTSVSLPVWTLISRRVWASLLSQRALQHTAALCMPRRPEKRTARGVNVRQDWNVTLAQDEVGLGRRRPVGSLRKKLPHRTQRGSLRKTSE